MLVESVDDGSAAVTPLSLLRLYQGLDHPYTLASAPTVAAITVLDASVLNTNLNHLRTFVFI